MMHQFGQRPESTLRRDVHLKQAADNLRQLSKSNQFMRKTHPSFGILADTIMIDAAFVPQWNGSLPGTGFRFAHQKTSVDTRAEQIFGCIAWDGPVVPRVLLQRIHGRHVIRWHPAHTTRGRMSFAPFATFVVAQYPHLFACKIETKLVSDHLEVAKSSPILNLS